MKPPTTQVEEHSRHEKVTPVTTKSTDLEKVAKSNPKNVVKPGEKLLCIDTKSVVIVTNTIIFIYATIHVGWNIFVVRYFNAGFSGGIIVLCLVVFLNIFAIKSAASYVTIATTMMLFVCANYGLIGYQYYNEFKKRSLNDLPPPPFEGLVVALILGFGLIQLYRLQTFNDALHFAERKSIFGLHKLRRFHQAKPGTVGANTVAFPTHVMPSETPHDTMTGASPESPAGPVPGHNND